MASSRRKSAAIALAVVGIAGLSLASAAQLNVNSSALGAGTTVVASCDDAVDVDFTTAYATGSYQASAITVSDIADTCEGQLIRVTVTAGSTVVVSDVVASKTIADGETSVTFPFAAQAAKDIDGVSIVIAG